MQVPHWGWFVVSIIFSIFWGIRAAIYYAGKYPTVYQTIFEKIYHFVFHFIGSMAGWVCFYILFQKVTNVCDLSLLEVSLGNVVLFIFALLGLTGHLPQTIYGFVESFSLIAKEAAKRISK